jgi:hypothetical protein
MGGHGKAMGMPAPSFSEQEILQPGQPTVGRGCPQPIRRLAGPAEAVEEDGPLGRAAEACAAGPMAGQLARLSDSGTTTAATASGATSRHQAPIDSAHRGP